MTENYKNSYRSFKQVVNALYQEEISLEDRETSLLRRGEKEVRIEPKLVYDKTQKEVKIEFRIGTVQLYPMKELTTFYEQMQKKALGKYGNKLEFVHSPENFTAEARPLLDFMTKQIEVMKFVNENGNSGYRYCGKIMDDSHLLLNSSSLDEFMTLATGTQVLWQEEETEQLVYISPKEPRISFVLEQIGEEYVLKPNIESYECVVLSGKEHKYVRINHTIYCCDQTFEDTVLKVISIFRKNFTKEIHFSKKELPDFFSLILPKIEKYIEYEKVDQEEIKSYIPQELKATLFLDIEKRGYILAKVKFSYGTIEFNPLDMQNIPLVARDIMKEAKAFQLFYQTGFMLDKQNHQFILTKEEDIYEFLANELGIYQSRFEILITEQLRDRKIREPKLGEIGVRIENDLLKIDFSNLSFDRKELKEILDKYQLRKKYHRLKDGSFLRLENNQEIHFLNDLITGMDIDAKQLEEGMIAVPAYRGMYLEKLLEKLESTQIKKEEQYDQMVRQISVVEEKEETSIPSPIQEKLRTYQKIGCQWLKTLEEYHLGGILADDMGLGKTLQVLAMIVSYLEKEKENRLPSIVIGPSSLSLNWKKEIEKFAPEIKVMVIQGKAEERKQKMKQIPQYDLIVTSYDLLKRDIEIYEEMNYEFKYAIADEAQYIKNSRTQNAKALKMIRAKTRFALTGTPIENSLAELWSIFDYIMPGYLFSYRKFKAAFEVPIIKDNDLEAMGRLKMLIEPFVLRRVKKEVLKELPEKTITILNNEMGEEQEKVYMSYLAQAKAEVTEELEHNSFGKSQIKILALLTRLRQICCHPSLFLSNYEGDSSKLNQCMELVRDGIDSGHKILLFSGYTSMFSIMEEKLQKEGISYYKLTGSTKVEERVDLVEDFNNNPQIKVFLISLKAGGTGLNLIGADMVIHYDPWWNISAENQATDRAYRIGQEKNVQVYKLITQNSIEEKMYELQQKKAELIDQMLDTKTTFINRLSKEEMMGLFE